MLSAALTDFFAVLACVFAFYKGGWAERIGAAVILANTIAYIVNETTFHNSVANLIIDALTAVAFLGVAVRYASFWQGAVMLLYAMQFSLHAFYFVLERPRDMLHVIVNDVVFFAILACLATGTALAWRRRRRAARA
jgi:K+-sensing histidine kinase KdpD